jgi:steroid delta-isomerase-like uncharacterized protein
MNAAAVQAPTVLDRAFVEDWAARYLAAWNAHDVEAIVAMCTEDVVWNDPAIPAPVHGHAGVRHFVEATFRCFPDVRIEELEALYLSPAAPRVLSPYRFSATMLGPWEPTDIAPTGRAISFDGVDQWEFRGDRMCRYDTKYDMLALARQMGMLPPQGSLGDRIATKLQHLQARFQRRRAG